MVAPAQLPRPRRITRIRDWSQTPPSGPPPSGVASAVEEKPAPAPVAVPVDLAPCSDCLRELMDPQNRRYRYPFINCGQCGPGFTIVRALPYDREQTTMARFKMCVACRHEHDDPGDRRFQFASSACPACGPRLQLVVAGRPQATGELALGAAVAALRAGQIVALKGVGGFVLMLVAVALGLQALRRGRHPELRVAGGTTARRTGSSGRKGSIIDRLEERWRQRPEGER